jgi:hypothetical protein
MAGVTTVNFVVADPYAAMKFYDELMVLRSTTGKTGVYAEVTSASTRMALELDKRLYTYTDSAVDIDNNWYRVQFRNSGTGTTSAQCDPVQGNQDPALRVISVDELKNNYFFGLDMTDDNGQEFDDSLYEFYIKSAVSLAEVYLDVPIRIQKFVASDPERLDLFRQDYYKYIALQLDHFPVLSVEGIQLVLPVEQTVINFDPSWINVDKFSGQIHIIPGQGQAGVVALGVAGTWLPLVHRGTDFIPHVFRVEYTAGFDDVPFALKEFVGKIAAIGPLSLAGDLILGAGIGAQQLSMDGLSQSISSTASATSAGYGARIRQYTQQIKEDRKILRQYYKGVMFQVA